MKSVIFKKISIQNFLSVDEETVVIEFTKGLHVLTGNNLDKPDRQNAVGKSSMADGIYFAIFGDTLREIKKELITNNITGGRTQVELDFDVISSKGIDSYSIIRTLLPNKVSIYKNGIDKTRDSIANTTKYICNVLSASPSIFQNCVIMTVNNAVPFMAKNKVEKRKFIEDIFGMEVFSRMISSLRQEYNELKKDHEVHLSRLDEIHNYTNTYNTQRDLVINRREEKLKLYKERQSNNKDNLRTLLKEKNNALVDDTVLINAELIIHKLENKLCDCDNKINNIREVSGGKRVEVKLLIDTYKKIGTDTQKCPVCLKSIDDHDKEVINQEKVKLKADIAIFKDEIDALAESLEKIILIKEKTKKAIQVKSNDLNNIKLKINNINNINQKIDQINKWQTELIEDIASINISNTEFDDLIKETEERLLELEETVKVCAKKISQLDIVKYVVSEEGVKSYIVNKLLELLNSKLFFYIKKLDSNSVCIFNEYFEEQILNEQNKVCSYFNFSGAERKSIDLACLFTFSDIRRVQGGVSYNIAIYDELFDSSFDEKGIELITDILKERVEMFNECAIVISHRKESVKAVTGEVIYLEKSKGITRRVNYSDY